VAVGFILSTEISKVIASAVNDLLNPLFSVITRTTGNFTDKYVSFGDIKIYWGNFVSTIINFIIIIFLIYFAVTKLDSIKTKKKKG